MRDDSAPKLKWNEPMRGVFARARDQWPVGHKMLVRLFRFALIVGVPLSALLIGLCYWLIPYFSLDWSRVWVVVLVPPSLYGVIWFETHFIPNGVRLHRGRIWYVRNNTTREVEPGNLKAFAIQATPYGESLCITFFHTNVRGGPRDVSMCFLLTDRVDREDLLSRLEDFCPGGQVDRIEVEGIAPPDLPACDADDYSQGP